MELDPKATSNERRLSGVRSHLVTALLSVIITGAALAWVRFPRDYGTEITLVPPQPLSGTIYVGGAVTSPGYYPLRAGDRIEDLLKAAGGVTENASPDRLKLYASLHDEGREAQLVDINRAPAWLLQALPGIGEARANAIINYRLQNGGFRSASELTRVEGISAGIYESIKSLITVAD